MEAIYKEYGTQVFKFIYRLSGDHDLSEELTQETFYRAFLNMKSYTGTCKMNVWLCQIAKHLWYQELDRRKRRKTEVLDENLPSEEPSLADKAILAMEKMSLYKAIHTLEEPMKEVVLLRLSNEFSFAEIGEILGKNETWARVTFYRAKKKMMEVI